MTPSWSLVLVLGRSRACVRDADGDKAAFLRAMPQCVTGRLTLHSCNIMLTFSVYFPPSANREVAA